MVPETSLLSCLSSATLNPITSSMFVELDPNFPFLHYHSCSETYHLTPDYFINFLITLPVPFSPSQTFAQVHWIYLCKTPLITLFCFNHPPTPQVFHCLIWSSSAWQGKPSTIRPLLTWEALFPASPSMNALLWLNWSLTKPAFYVLSYICPKCSPLPNQIDFLKGPTNISFLQAVSLCLRLPRPLPLVGTTQVLDLGRHASWCWLSTVYMSYPNQIRNSWAAGTKS